MRRITVLLIATVLFLTSILNTMALGNSTIDINAAETIATNQIRVLAVKSLAEWEGAVPVDPISLFDLRGNNKAFGFNVKNEDKVIGYIS